MEGLPFLRDLVVLLAVGIAVVVIAQRLRLPTVAGYLLAGVAIGPYGFGLIARTSSVDELAELGVLLLLFTIGLELSLSRILQLGRVVLQGGAMQVGVTLLMGAAASGLWLGVSWNHALFYSALLALSSTAIVLKLYADRVELDSPAGRVVVPILLFQDLCVVPLMLLVPVLARADSDGMAGIWSAVGTSLLVVIALMIAGRRIVPWVLDRVVLLRNRELFTLCIGFFGLGAAFITASFGLSLALGAFLAGLVISESEYGLQAVSDVRPFRDTFSGIFFTSVGMLFDIEFLTSSLLLVVGTAGVILLIKIAVTTGTVLLLRRTFHTSLLAGMALAQVGEFSFLLASVGREDGLFSGSDYQLFISASVLTMVLTPALIAAARPLADTLSSRLGLALPSVRPSETEGLAGLRNHAIIVGYGLSGRHLVQVLEAAGVAYVALEQNGQVVRKARQEGIRIFFGDGTREETLDRVGIASARVVIFAIASPTDERRGVTIAHRRNPGARVLVRTRYVAAIDELMRLGASEVVVEEFEATLELFARVLEFYEIPTNTIQHELAAVRNEHYRMLRGDSLASLRLDALRHLGIHGALDLVEVEAGSLAIGKDPTALNLRKRTGATVVTVVRSGKAYQPDLSFGFLPGDTVVLVGDRESLDKGSAVFKAPVDTGASP
ncbi:MAG TPA: cation:proton antiporter [Vicinamibacteria bacterium]|jgi:CPA2 family monovalent cation:H+ antiporter-2